MTRSGLPGSLSDLQGHASHPMGWRHPLVALRNRTNSSGNHRMSEHGDDRADSSVEREELQPAAGGPDMPTSAVGVNIQLEQGASQDAVVDELTAHGLHEEQVLVLNN